MASLFHKAPPPKVYYDRKTYSSFQKYIDDLEGSRTLYVGNLAFSTTDTQVRELFCSVGQVEKVIMGLDRLKRTRCGFCFVEMGSSEEAINAVNYLSDTALDGVIIRIELDPGFRPGRQYGRGMSGGQVRDEKRKFFDPARGGLGRQAEKQMFYREKRKRDEYSAIGTDKGGDDGNEEEGDDNRREHLMYGELSAKRRRHITQEDDRPTDQGDDGREGNEEQQSENNNDIPPTEAAAETPFSRNDEILDDREASSDDKMPQDDRLDEEVVLYREE